MSIKIVKIWILIISNFAIFLRHLGPSSILSSDAGGSNQNLNIIWKMDYLISSTFFLVNAKIFKAFRHTICNKK